MPSTDISDAARARVYLAEQQFHFSRALGQNFLLDDGWNERIAALSGADEGSNVLEIGPGAGTLTCALAKTGANVLAVEIDTALSEILGKMLAPYPNVHVEFADITKVALDTFVPEHFGMNCAYQVVSNLPYSITAELLPRLAASARPPKSITAMVQREAAERMCAAPGEKNWCALAARMQYFYAMDIVDILPPHAFTPNAHVESALIHCKLLEGSERAAVPADEGLFLRCLDAAFAMRRKTYANNLMERFSMKREDALAILAEAGLSATIRGEVLTLAQIAKVADRITSK